MPGHHPNSDSISRSNNVRFSILLASKILPCFLKESTCSFSSLSIPSVAYSRILWGVEKKVLGYI